MRVHLGRHPLLSCENSTEAINRQVQFAAYCVCLLLRLSYIHAYIYHCAPVCACASERAPVAKFITRCSRARQLISMCWLRDRYVARALEEGGRYLFSEKQRSRQGRTTTRRHEADLPTYTHPHILCTCTELPPMGIRCHWRTIRESRRTESVSTIYIRSAKGPSDMVHAADGGGE